MCIDWSFVSALVHRYTRTTRTAPRLVRSTKLSPVRRGSCLEGLSNTNTPCSLPRVVITSFFFSIFFFPFQGDINLLPRVLSLEVEREDPGNEVEAILVTAELPVLCDVFFFQFINYFVQIIRHVCIHLRSICLK